MPDQDVSLRGRGDGHFYSIKKNNIVEVTAAGGPQQVGSGGSAASSRAPRASAGPSYLGVQHGGVQKHRASQAKPEKEYEVSPECVICMGAESSLVFVPCGHLCTCPSCGNRINTCCICRGPIASVVHKK